MSLPPSIRPYWSQLQADKAAAPEHRAWEWAEDPFKAKKEVESRQERRKEKEAVRNGDGDGGGAGGGHGTGATNGRQGATDGGKGGVQWSRAPEVKMSGALREMVENTVRKVRSACILRVG
jgi:ATP-dependent RNA helicase DHX57